MKTPRTKREPYPLPPAETPRQLEARLIGYTLATREQAMRPVSATMPDHVTVLAGPLRRVRAC